MSAVAQIGQPHIREEDVEKGVNKRTKRLKNKGSAVAVRAKMGQQHSISSTTDITGIGGLPHEDLYREFMLAVFDVGLKAASPKLILEKMPNSSSMTVNRIKSHLQKIRQNKSRSYKEFQHIDERLLMGGLRAWIYGLENILADDLGFDKEYVFSNKQHLENVTATAPPPSTNAPPLEVPQLFSPSFSSMDLSLVRDSLGLGGLSQEASNDDPPLDLNATAFKPVSVDDGKIIHSGMTMPMLDPSNSVVLSGGFPLDTQKTTDGHAPSIEWTTSFPSSSKPLDHVLQHHGYATELPVGPETPRPSRLPYAREKNAKHHFVPPATPDIEVEVSEALRDLFAGFHTQKPRRSD